MQFKKLNSKGFTAIEAILIIVVLAAIGGVGYYVYHSNHKSKNDSSYSSKSAVKPKDTQAKKAQATTTPAKTEKPADIEVIQADQSIKLEPANELAKTNDELDVLNALAKKCATSPPNVYASVNYQVFDPSLKLYVQDGNYAKIDTSCEAKITSLDQSSGGGEGYYLHKQDSVWTVDAITIMGAPFCSKVDGKGYPATIAPKCYETDAHSTVLRATKE